MSESIGIETPNFGDGDGHRSLIRGHARLVFFRFVDAMIPEGDDGLGPSGLAAGVPDRVDAFLEAMPEGPRRLVPLALWAVELYPLCLGPGLRPFSWLSRPERERVLERLEHHVFYPLRSAYLALKLFSFLLWAEHPDVARATHWGQSCGAKRTPST